jgi:hypothetical protein
MKTGKRRKKEGNTSWSSRSSDDESVASKPLSPGQPVRKHSARDHKSDHANGKAISLIDNGCSTKIIQENHPGMSDILPALSPITGISATLASGSDRLVDSAGQSSASRFSTVERHKKGKTITNFEGLQMQIWNF